MNYPVLILAFNRADGFTNTLNSLLGQGFREVYVSIDGCRDYFPFETRETIQRALEAKRNGLIKELNLLPVNHGILFGIQKGISWYFSKVEAGYVIEDDLILQDGALTEADSAMDYLMTSSNIASVNLRNIVPLAYILEPEATFRFSRLTTSHGWGTTARYWFESLNQRKDGLDISLALRFFRFYGIIPGLSWLRRYQLELQRIKLSPSQGVWDIHWTVFHACSNYQSIFMNRSRVLYDGYGMEATNTKFRPKNIEFTYLNGEDLTLSSPKAKIVDHSADAYLNRHGFSIGLIKSLKKKLAIRSRLRVYRKKPKF